MPGRQRSAAKTVAKLVDELEPLLDKLCELCPEQYRLAPPDDCGKDEMRRRYIAWNAWSDCREAVSGLQMSLAELQSVLESRVENAAANADGGDSHEG